MKNISTYIKESRIIDSNGIITNFNNIIDACIDSKKYNINKINSSDDIKEIFKKLTISKNKKIIEILYDAYINKTKCLLFKRLYDDTTSFSLWINNYIPRKPTCKFKYMDEYKGDYKDMFIDMHELWKYFKDNNLKFENDWNLDVCANIFKRF